MLRDDDASHQVWCDGDAGALKAMQTGALAVEMSTLSLPWVTRLATHAASHQVAFLDAPVVGSTPAAQNKKLAFLAGGQRRGVRAGRLKQWLNLLRRRFAQAASGV
jgi:3-hydroxyisobutyrate dehydrogenase